MSVFVLDRLKLFPGYAQLFGVCVSVSVVVVVKSGDFYNCLFPI